MSVKGYKPQPDYSKTEGEVVFFVNEELRKSAKSPEITAFKKTLRKIFDPRPLECCFRIEKYYCSCQ